MKDKISGLIRLQDCDNRIKEILSKKNEMPLKIKRLESELNASEVKFHEEYNRLEMLKRDRRTLEQDVQEIENRIEKSGIKLNNVKSNKEYKAALKEIDDQNREKSLKEDKVIQIMEETEELEKVCIENKKVQVDLTKKFEMDRDEIEKELKLLDNESEILDKQRKEFSQVVDQDLFKKYLFLKERKGGLAIGPVVKGICQACHMGIPPQQFNELRKGHSLLTCPNCNRLIYWGEDESYQNLDKETNGSK